MFYLILESINDRKQDVLVALGIVELPVRQLGLEIAGVVTRIGQDVNHIKIGDRVCCPTQDGLCSVVKSAEKFCMRVPENMSLEEAATMIVPYGTAFYSLINIGQLKKGQVRRCDPRILSVLSHS